MRKHILLADREVHYKFLRFKRQKYMRLTVHSDATLTVTAPKWVRVAEVEIFIQKQAKWILESLDKFRSDGALLCGSRAEYLRYKERARALAHHRLRHFNLHYGLLWNRISIRGQRTMWGSCSAEGNLNFNYKIVLLPPELADYVIVHELCHLREMNHSKAFWDLVAETIPDHKERRRLLKYAKMGVV